MDKQLTHLGFIQAVITRMGANSFMLKGWSVTLVAALFALSAKDTDHRFVLLAYFPVFVFWGLDAFFLRQEKLFRALYDAVAAGTVNSDLLSMDTAPVAAKVDDFGKVFFSKTLRWFHGVIAAVVLLAMLAFLCGHAP